MCTAAARRRDVEWVRRCSRAASPRATLPTTTNALPVQGPSRSAACAAAGGSTSSTASAHRREMSIAEPLGGLPHLCGRAPSAPRTAPARPPCTPRCARRASGRRRRADPRRGLHDRLLSAENARPQRGLVDRLAARGGHRLHRAGQAWARAFVGREALEAQRGGAAAQARHLDDADAAPRRRDPLARRRVRRIPPPATTPPTSPSATSAPTISPRSPTSGSRRRGRAPHRYAATLHPAPFDPK